MGTLCTSCSVSVNLTLELSECKGVEDPACRGEGHRQTEVLSFESDG